MGCIKGDLHSAFPEGSAVKLTNVAGLEEDFEGLVPEGCFGIVVGHHSGCTGMGVVFVSFIEPNGSMYDNVCCDPEWLSPADASVFKFEVPSAPGFTDEQREYRLQAWKQKEEALGGGEEE